MFGRRVYYSRTTVRESAWAHVTGPGVIETKILTAKLPLRMWRYW